MTERAIIAEVDAATGDRVKVGKAELLHAMKHFLLPEDILVQLLTRILQRPTEVYTDDTKHPHEYRLFYRLDDANYLLVVVKITPNGAFFASMYPTGRSIKTAHKKMKRVKL
ncbi:MAG: hypothetical protein HY537_07100 [Deltaproteobacteria bacterium]|nr:hypothetical protein [Deltaproteobacteria bacterium]